MPRDSIRTNPVSWRVQILCDEDIFSAAEKSEAKADYGETSQECRSRGFAELRWAISPLYEHPIQFD
jgi:hypothetical protein